LKRRTIVVALALVGLLLLAILLAGQFRRAPSPAPPGVLENIAEKNEKAAAEAAARQKAESEAAAEAADRALEANEARQY
jgi:hypothetical protein